MTREALFTVRGMDCAECADRIGKKLDSLKGVRSARINFATERLRLEYDPQTIDPGKVTAVVRALGYEAQPIGTTAPPARTWWRKPNIVLLALCGLMTAAGFGLDLAGMPEPWLKTVFGLAILLGGYYPARNGWRALWDLSPNIQTLLVAAAFGAITLDLWEEAAVLVFIFSLGEILEAYAVNKARGSIRTLLALAPREARLRRNGRELTLPVEQIEVHDVLIVRPGEKIAMDGTVMSGRSAVDQAVITGESIPIAKEPGDAVFAGTLNQRGALEVRVTKRVADTTLAHIIHAVEEAQANKSSYQRFGDRFGRVYTPAMFALAILVAVIPSAVFGQPFTSWFYRGLIILVVSCSCGLVLSVPVSVIAAISTAARKGLLIKGGAYLEGAAGVKVVAIDKTGTLTIGKPDVTDIVAIAEYTETEILSLAAAIENRSEHPLADAILRKAREHDIHFPKVEGFESFPGEGACGKIGGKSLCIGARRLFQRQGLTLHEIEDELQKREEEGKTVLVLAEAGRIAGIIAVADRLRPEIPDAVAAMYAGGVRKIVMLTGDNEGTARAIAREAGIDDYRAGLLPAEKVAVIKELKAQGDKIAMIGDGVNDAPALAVADVGIAMGAAGADAAIEAADVALMSDDLKKVPLFLILSRRAVNNIKQNIVASLLIVALLVPAALMGWVGLVDGLLLNEGAALVVIANGLRLLRVTLQGERHVHG